MNGQSGQLVFRIEGMDCAEEITLLKHAVGPFAGEENLSFDLLNSRMIVRTAAPTVTSDQIIRAVGAAGLRASLWSDDAAPREAEGQAYRQRAWLTTISGIGLAAGFIVHLVWSGGWQAAIGHSGPEMPASPPILVRALYGLSTLAGVWLVLPKAWNALRSFRPDMNLLMTVAVCGAIAIGEWFEAASVSFLFAVSLLLESWSVGRARRAITALLTLAPSTARVVREGKEQEIPAEQVAKEEIVVIRPGERIAIDGQVVEGISHVNQAPITGESQPVEKSVGSDVFAGTVNGDGLLKVKCTRTAGQTTLAGIIRMVGEAQSRRAPSEQWVDRFARVYTPTVMVLAILVLLIPPIFAGGEWFTWIYNALVLLIVACPCALVISTPVSVVAALTAAANQGVLIKGGPFVELPAHLQAIAFDKTGTLTAGRPSVVELVPLNGHSEPELLTRASAMEQGSDHPLALAIVEFARSKGVEPPPASDFQIIQGKGATATFDGRRFWLGSHRYLEERKQETPEVHNRLEEMSRGGRSVVVIGNEEHVCGLIALADEIRPHIKQTLEEIRRLGVKHLIMLTGDNAPTAQAIAQRAGIDAVRSELLPADKVTAVEELVREYGQVAMIGDGVNDAPALARASLGIAMGAVGSDAAIETADIALMTDDVSRVAWLIRHSRQTVSIIRQNIIFSLAVKMLFVILTFAGFSSLWMAIAADTGASLLVIGNSLRLLSGGKRQAGGKRVA